MLEKVQLNCTCNMRRWGAIAGSEEGMWRGLEGDRVVRV